jgi:hypothetical protein
MHKNRYFYLLPLIIGFIISQAVNAGNGPPGSSSNPVITKSYAEKIFQPLREQVSGLRGEIDKIKEQNQPKPSFSDVTDKHWAFGDIQYMVEKGIISGIGEGKFGPDKPTRRCELAVMLVKALNLPIEEAKLEFIDVPNNHWAYAQIAAAQKAGIISGFPGGLFKPDSYVTRGQIAVMLARAFELKRNNLTIDFKDVPPNYWAYDAVKKLSENNISKGFEDNTFRPALQVRRAEVAVLLAKALDPGRRK